MGFPRFRFTKLWTNPVDFPTVETDENRVRADMQALHDEAKDGLNRLMDQLEAPEAAEHIGVAAADGSESTLQAEVSGLQKDRHTHENSSILKDVAVALTQTLAEAYNRLVALFAGVERVATTLGEDDTTIPTSKAVRDALENLEIPEGTGSGLPAGGETGQALVKASGEDGDCTWADVVSLGEDGKISSDQLPELGSGAEVYTAAIGTNWTEDSTTGVKSQTVAIEGITADHTAKVDCVFAGNKDSDGYAAFVEQQNQYLEFITNGYAETVEGGITFYIFGDPNTVSIPIVVEVV